MRGGSTRSNGGGWGRRDGHCHCHRLSTHRVAAGHSDGSRNSLAWNGGRAAGRCGRERRSCGRTRHYGSLVYGLNKFQNETDLLKQISGALKVGK